METKQDSEETQYLSLIKEVLGHGIESDDRTGTGTFSLFGRSMRFNLEDGTIPLLTTKKMPWKSIVEELLWFISGKTDSAILSKKGVSIWDANTTKDFLEKRGLGHRRQGDAGPIYGFQWRHFGAKYIDCDTDYSGQGVDQLTNCIEMIKKDPNSRRIVMSAWNPCDLDTMALPPCHMFCQFYVRNGELSCQMYQRSADMGLGVPFNIASYALLTHMIAHVTGTKAKEFIHVIGDTHVYKDHVEPLKEQLGREPRQFPKLVIKREVYDIGSFISGDFEISGYNPHPAIKMKMSV